MLNELRFYLMFLGHYFDGGSWNDDNINGVRRFINRWNEWMSRTGENIVDVPKFKASVFAYTESFKFNKVVSSFMILLNENRTKNLTEECKMELRDILNIFMPGVK